MRVGFKFWLHLLKMKIFILSKLFCLYKGDGNNNNCQLNKANGVMK